MTKAAYSATEFLQRNQTQKDEFKESFQSKSLVRGQSIGMPISCKLSPSEENKIQKLLADYYNPSNTEEGEVSSHYHQLKTITEEVRSISAQSILLHGERIKRAQTLLKNYRDGAFTQWLTSTYGNRHTPYSMLRYYELYHDLKSEDLQKKLETMPKRAVYVLAFRDAPILLKRDIVDKYKGEKQNDIIREIQFRFPPAEYDNRRRRSPNAETIAKMFEFYKRIEMNLDDLNEKNKEKIQELIDKLNDLIA